MTEPRVNTVGLLLGKRNSGKTFFLLGSEYSSKPGDEKLKISGLLQSYLNTGFKVFIIDTLDHPSYRKIPILAQSAFLRFNKGVARAFMRPDKMKRLATLITNSPHMNNTFIVFEDAGKYTENKLPIEFKELIADSKQRNIDILFMYHSWADTPRDVFRKGLDYIQILKTEDTPMERRGNLRLYDQITAAHQRIQNHKSPFYGEFIDTSTN